MLNKLSASNGAPTLSSGSDVLRVQQSYFRQLLIGRTCTCAAILGVIGAILLTTNTTAEVAPIVLLLLALIGLTPVYGLIGARSSASVANVALAVIVADTLFLTFGEYLLGGQNAIYGLPLYGILIVMAAVIHSRSAAYAIALIGSVSYALMVGAAQFQFVPERQPLVVHSISETWPVATIATNLFLGLATALVAGSLSRIKDFALDLTEINHHLELRVEESVSEIRATNAELEGRNGELEQALRQVNLFAGAVSHDLRNPLTAANEALRLSADGNDRFIELARENLDRADDMLMGLRDVMQAFGNRSRSEQISVDNVLADLIREIETARPSCPAIEVRGPLGEVFGDRSALSHVFRNLITNAIDHNIDSKGLVVSIGRESSAELPSFFVSDTGKGIEKSIHERIFNPFHRGPDADVRGLGIGLALVRAIVSHTGGMVWVESVHGEGSTFRFSWPETASGRVDRHSEDRGEETVLESLAGRRRSDAFPPHG